MNVAERLNDHLSSRGAAAKIARLAGIDRETVMRIATGATGNPGFKTLAAIEDALDTLFLTPTPGQVKACERTASCAPGSRPGSAVASRRGL